MTKQRAVSATGTDETDLSHASGVQTDGAVNRSVILQAALFRAPETTEKELVP